MKQVEKKQKFKFRDKTQGRLKWIFIENRILAATPDSIMQNRNGTTAFVEWKQIIAWPKRANTLPLRGAFERGQLGFLRSWASWNGHAFVMLFCDNTLYLFNAVDRLKEMNTGALINKCLAIGFDNVVDYLENI